MTDHKAISGRPTHRLACWQVLALGVCCLLLGGLQTPSYAQPISQSLPLGPPDANSVQTIQDPAGPSLPSSLPATVTNALGQLLGTQNSNSTAESLPTPSEAVAPAGRTGFTIPLNDIGDRSAIKVSDDQGKISLAVRDAPLRHVLSMIADARHLNLVFASSTDVPVTATLDRVPLEQALDSLLSASGYTWALNGDVIYVTSVAAAESLPFNVQGRRLAVLDLDFASAIDVDQAVKGLLSPVGKSWVMETSSSDNRRTKDTIVVEDLNAYVSRIEQYVAEADQPPRQVMIEVHILEVDLDRDKRVGVDLQAVLRASGARIELMGAGLASANSTPSFILETTGGDLTPVIEALITTTDAKTLASPRVLAVNGQQSRINIGDRLGFRTTSTTQAGVTQENVNFLNVGVELLVTPRITRDGRVLMQVQPKVSDGTINTEGLPEEATTEMRTDVLLSSGQGMIVGGLIQERDSTVISKTPLLGSIPYAGFFFQKRVLLKKRSEIIVALAPSILPYEPVAQARNDHEYMRATQPLVYGPLCRFPRPYEPRLADVMRDHPPGICQYDDPCCGPPVVYHGATPRRLPPVESEECEACVPEVANRPINRFRY